MDSTVKIWDVYSNNYCSEYTHCTSKIDKNTELIEPLQSLEGDHQSGVKLIAMNQSYLASYSTEDNCLVIRDWEKVTKPLFKLSDVNDAIKVKLHDRGESKNGKVYSGANFEIGHMILCKENP